MIEHIEYLMLSNDCVVVPGFGAFIAQYSHSDNNAFTSAFTSPRRSISFNASITHNDGLLANSIAKKNGISYAEAMSEIENGTTICRQTLSAGSEIPFGRLGFFISNEETFEFVPFHHEHADDEFFGLQSFHFPTLAQLAQKPAAKPAAAVLTEMSEVPAEFATRKASWTGHKVLQIAASIIVLFCLTFALSTPIVIDHQSQQLATMHVPAPKAPKKQVAAPAPAAKPAPVETPVVQPTAAATGRYAIVICSLKTQKQVDQFFALNPGINTGNVARKNGFYMIYFDRSDNYPELLNKAKQLPKAYAQYWITQI